MIDFAIKEARKNPIEPIGRNSISRFAAILFDGRGTIFTAFNSYKSHPLQAKFGINSESVHLHAEVNCLVKATRWFAQRKGVNYSQIVDLSDFSMAVARVLRDGTPALAKPCTGCAKALIAFGIRDVSWTI